MPKIVDHETQRTTFAEAAIRLVARRGLEGVTMRAVAKEAGLSYGSLFHYFDSKDDLLLYMVEHTMALQTRRVNEYTTRFAGLAALEQLLSDDAVTDDPSRDAWMVWQTFLYKAALQPTFARVHARLIDGWLGRFRQLLQDARMAGDVSWELDVEFEAKALWAYSAGIGQMGLLNPELLPPALQRQMIRTYLDRLRRDA